MDNSPINNLVDIQLGMNTGAHLYERLHEQIISSLWHSQETYLCKHVLSSCSFSQPIHDITTFRYKISIIFVAQICSSQSSKWHYSIRWNATPPQTPKYSDRNSLTRQQAEILAPCGNLHPKAMVRKYLGPLLEAGLGRVGQVAISWPDSLCPQVSAPLKK